MSRLFLAISFLMFSFEGLAQSWYYIGTSQGEGKYYIYYKTEKPDFEFSTEVNSFNIWVKIEEKTFKYYGGSKPKTYYNVVVKYLYHIDCSTNSISKKQAAVYDSKGNLIISEEFYEIDKTVIPESMGETILEASCLLHQKELIKKE